jgi:hypothetical protein
MSTHTPTGRDDFLETRAYDPFLRPAPLDPFAPLTMVSGHLLVLRNYGVKYRGPEYVEAMEDALTVVRSIQAGAR